MPWAALGLFAADVLLDERRAEEEAETLRFNADQLEQQAREVLQQGLVVSRELRVQGQRQQGRTIADVGASGIALSGSPLDALVDQSIQFEKGARQANFAAVSESRILRQEADNARIAARNRERGTLQDIFRRNVLDPINENIVDPLDSVKKVLGF